MSAPIRPAKIKIELSPLVQSESFVMYNAGSQEELVRIEGKEVKWLHPAIAKQMKKIPVGSCDLLIPHRKQVFGDALFLEVGHPNYPWAVELYCKWVFLAKNPKSYITELPKSMAEKIEDAKKLVAAKKVADKQIIKA